MTSPRWLASTYRYVRDEKGTFIITRSYELGSYAFGSHRIYVMANDPANNAIVGTEVADNVLGACRAPCNEGRPSMSRMAVPRH